MPKDTKDTLSVKTEFTRTQNNKLEQIRWFFEMEPIHARLSGQCKALTLLAFQMSAD